MMENGESVWGIIITILFVWAIFHFFGWKSNEDKLREALQSANDEISYCNSEIQNAKNYAWSDYQEMGNALSDIGYCSDVPNPTK